MDFVSVPCAPNNKLGAKNAIPARAALLPKNSHLVFCIDSPLKLLFMNLNQKFRGLGVLMIQKQACFVIKCRNSLHILRT